MKVRRFSVSSAGVRAGRLWRRSLHLRMLVISLSLSGVAIILVGVYMSLSISNDLFNSRLSQVLSESQRAQVAAQRIFDSSDATDRASMQSVMNAARTAIQDASSSGLVAIFRAPGQEPSLISPQDFASTELTGGVITPELREQVTSNPDQQYWQSTELINQGVLVPGVVVGSQLSIPGAGAYEMYIGFDFEQADQTLLFIQQVLWVAGIGLLILVAAIAWYVTRLVVTPIRNAANTSEQLASGDLEVRIPEKGEDVVATLAKSFNDMADSLQQQLNTLGELSVMQQRFVSDVSHELRTPLTTIKLAGDVLYQNRDQLDANSRRSAELLHTQIERFEKLLADLLEISRYDAGNVNVDRESTNIAVLVEDVVKGMTPLAEDNSSVLIFEAPGGHLEAQVDPRRIRRIITNLIGNAIEHGEGKPINIAVDSNENAVAVSVRDHGVGMEPEELQHVFSRFWRADPSRQRTLGGTGLGLAISLEDARIHNGALDVWAAPGQGAVFRLTLPRKPGQPMGDSPLPLEPEVLA